MNDWRVVSSIDPETETETRVEEEQQTAPGEGWAVLLFNDDHNSMDYVVVVLMDATGFAPERCAEIMLQAHYNGKAVVTITERPEAERICEKLTTAGLTSIIKRMG